MSEPKITQLTSEQEALIPVYREKWQQISLTTKKLDRDCAPGRCCDRVAEIIKNAYLVSNFSVPKILFYGHPLAAIQDIIYRENFRDYLGTSIKSKFSNRVIRHLESGIKQQLNESLFLGLKNKIQFPKFPYYSTQECPQSSYFPDSISNYVESQLISDLKKFDFNLEYGDILYFTNHLTIPKQWSVLGCMFDFCISVLKLNHDRKKWFAIQQLIQHSSLLFKYKNVCLVCDRAIGRSPREADRTIVLITNLVFTLKINLQLHLLTNLKCRSATVSD